MAKLGWRQIIGYAQLAGFQGEQALIATGIAMAESGGNTLATNNNTNGTTDHGLWQINSVHKDILRMGDWRDPATNARMAYAVYRKQGWTAWMTWTQTRTWPDGGTGTPAEREIALILVETLGPKAKEAAKATVDNAIGGAGAAIGAVGDAGADALAEWTREQALYQVGQVVGWLTTPANWGRIVLVVVGGALAVAGLYAAMRGK